MSTTNIAAYSNIINRLAYQFSNLSAIDPIKFSHEDLVSEGWLTLGMLQKEEARRVANGEEPCTEKQMQSYLGQVFKQNLLNFVTGTKMQVRGQLQYRPVPVEYTEVPEEDTVAQISLDDLHSVATKDFSDRSNTFIDLSTEAREVVDIIFSAPAELLEMAGIFVTLPRPDGKTQMDGKEITLEHIKTYLNKHRGWSWNKIYKFWVEIGLSAH